MAVGPAIRLCPVEVPIGGLDEPNYGVFAVPAVWLGAEAVKCGQRATRGDFEDRPALVCPTGGCPVEVPIGGLDQPREGVFAVRAVCLGAEAVKRRQRATRGDFEDGAIVAAGPTTGRCPVEVPIGGLE